jgi:hypothetical protein
LWPRRELWLLPKLRLLLELGLLLKLWLLLLKRRRLLRKRLCLGGAGAEAKEKRKDGDARHVGRSRGYRSGRPQA